MDFIESTGSLDFTNTKKIDLDQELFYFVEWSKVQNVEQMVLILQAMGFGISSKHVHFESIKEFLNLDYPVRPQ
jgi:hypothetical protein